ncbi:MAG: hypothetical protein HY905_13010 [Deltaproteobacteria bacterium]|nr:hypothetical protein [Deltaproteobacteria bacterium]
MEGDSSDDWPMRVCRVGSGGMCEVGGTPPGTEVGGGSASWHTDGGAVAAGSSSIAPTRSWSMVPSRAFAYRMYFVFQHRESSGAAKDVYLGWGTYDPVAHTWTWSGGPYAVAQFTDDGKDQFNPSLNVVWGGGTYESLHASWYDRRADCLVGTVPCTAGSINKTNYCFRRRRSWSTTGSAWGYWQDSQVGLTDPACLPTTCDSFATIWIGAYQDGLGPAMHSHHLWSEGITGVPWSGRLQEGFLSVGGFYTYP